MHALTKLRQARLAQAQQLGLMLENLAASPAPTGPSQVGVFGLTRYSDSIVQYLLELGIAAVYVLDGAEIGALRNAVPVLAPDALDRASVIISGIIEGRPRTVHERLQKLAFLHVYSYFDLSLLQPERFAVPFSEYNQIDLDSNAQHYHWLANLLADQQSKQTLQQLLALRYASEFASLSLQYDLAGQYWAQDLLDFSSIKSFVDGGAFDGATALAFAKRCPDYQHIDLIEPHQVSMARCQAATANLAHIRYLQAGLSDRASKAQLSIDASSANRVVQSGGMDIDLVAIDEFRSAPMDYIKLDIEGFELAALHGAKSTIMQDHPILAVCVYHDQRHFWQVPQYILGLRADYQVYLRHYTEGIYESVMYFVPRKNATTAKVIE